MNTEPRKYYSTDDVVATLRRKGNELISNQFSETKVGVDVVECSTVDQWLEEQLTPEKVKVVKGQLWAYRMWRNNSDYKLCKRW